MSYQKHIPSNTSLKYIAWVTPVLLFALLIGAGFFYKERMLYIDAPHVLFRIINNGHFWIEEHRYGSFISQVLPLIGAKLHLSLQWLMILYSISFYLFYLVASFLLVCTFRNYGLAVLLGLYFTLFVSDTYYWPNNEVHQGITWLLLVFAVNSFVAAKTKKLFTTSLLFILSFFFAIWTHPLVMLAAVYMWLFFMLDASTWPYSKVQSVIFSIFLLLLSYIKFNQGMHHGYDSSKIEMVTQFQFKKIKTILTSPQLHFFLRSCIHQYKLFSLIFTAGILGLLAEKKYLLFIWTLLFVSGYLVLTCITFRDVSSRAYMESEYMPLVIISCAPFVYYILPKLKMSYGLALFAIIYLLRLGDIYNAAFPYTNRLVILEKINDRMKDKHLTKIIIPEPVAQIDSELIMNWAAPVESIYISKLKGEMPQRTFIFLPIGQIKTTDTIAKDTLLGSFEKRSAGQINSHYFQLDTTTTYKVVNYSTLME